MTQQTELYDKAVKIIRSCVTEDHIKSTRLFIDNVKNDQLKNHLNHLCDSRLHSITSQFMDDEDYFKAKWCKLNEQMPITEAPSSEIISELIVNYLKCDLQQFTEQLYTYASYKLTVYRNLKHLLIDYYGYVQKLRWSDESNIWIGIDEVEEDVIDEKEWEVSNQVELIAYIICIKQENEFVAYNSTPMISLSSAITKFHEVSRTEGDKELYLVNFAEKQVFGFATKGGAQIFGNTVDFDQYLD